jgi:hypothetical protein
MYVGIYICTRPDIERTVTTVGEYKVQHIEKGERGQRSLAGTAAVYIIVECSGCGGMG